MTGNPGRAFTFAFEDRRWPFKLGLLLLIGLIPGLNLIAWVGYAASIAHNIARDNHEPLPSWDDWADILVRGLLTWVAWFVYWLPIGILLGGILLTGLIAGTPDVGMIVFLVRAGGTLTIAVYGVFVALLLTVGGARYARTDHYHDYFAFRGRLREAGRQRGLFVLTFVYQALFGLALVVLLPPSIVTIVGPLVLITAYSVLNGYVIGQAARSLRLPSEKINRQA